jgi:hypothetical protein
MRFQWVQKGRVSLFLALAGVLLALCMGADNAPDNGLSARYRLLEEEMKAGRGPALLNVSYRMADLSLNVREQVDFLLTPALLVQEAVSDDVVLTYPEE